MTLELSGIHHDYGEGLVLHDVSFTVSRGRVHALLGLNGAGKSTLMHIAAGQFAPTSGTVTSDDSGEVALLAQEVDRALVPNMTVHENLTVAIASRSTFFSARRSRQLAQRILDDFDVAIDPSQLVESLSIFEKQLLSLVRVAVSEAGYVLLDEPTASFDARETKKFYSVARAIQERGVGIVFISHRLDEVMELADEVTVLRGGEVVVHAPIDEVTVEDIVTGMTGEDKGRLARRGQSTVREEPGFDVEGLQFRTDGPRLDLHIQRGEVVVVFGLLGAGKTSLARRIFGLNGPYNASLRGTVRRIRSAWQARSLGFAFVPEERRAHGLWLEDTAGENLYLTQGQPLDLLKRYFVTPADPNRRVRQFSGGNQQKISIAKWAGADALLILDEPMKGVDVDAKESLFTVIEDIAATGTPVLYLTAEADDALRIADRVIVLTRHGVVFDRAASELDTVTLMVTAEEGVAQ